MRGSPSRALVGQQTVRLAASNFCTDVCSALTLSTWRRISATRGHVVGPTYSSAIGRLQCFAYQIFWHVWTSPFSLGFSFPFALGLGLLGQRWLRWVFCFAFVGIVRIRLGRWLGRCCCSQWQKMETHCWPHQSNRELFFEWEF